MNDDPNDIKIIEHTHDHNCFATYAECPACDDIKKRTEAIVTSLRDAPHDCCDRISVLMHALKFAILFSSKRGQAIPVAISTASALVEAVAQTESMYEAEDTKPKPERSAPIGFLARDTGKVH
jgi:hypothetical protein